MKKDDILLTIALKGKLIGYAMILCSLSWFILGTGIRGFMEYGLGRWAILCLIIGIAIMVLSIAIDKKLK